MRSSKTRSRGKSNRNRSTGNNLNRVFDSSGPEGKVRGTPQQIIDKYTQLSRDAMLSNDRVAAENFLQHAEHYTRLLTEAQRQAEAKRLQAEAANRERQQREREEREARLARQEAQAAGTPAASGQQPAPASDPGEMEQPDTGAPAIGSGEADSGLVETPESKPKRAPRTRKPRTRAAKAKPKAEIGNEAGSEPVNEASADGSKPAAAE